MLETDVFIAYSTLVVLRLVSWVIVSDFCGASAFRAYNFIVPKIYVPIFAIFSYILRWYVAGVYMRTNNTVPTKILIVPVYTVVLFLFFLANRAWYLIGIKYNFIFLL